MQVASLAAEVVVTSIGSDEPPAITDQPNAMRIDAVPIRSVNLGRNEYIGSDISCRQTPDVDRIVSHRMIFTHGDACLLSRACTSGAAISPGNTRSCDSDFSTGRVEVEPPGARPSRQHVAPLQRGLCRPGPCERLLRGPAGYERCRGDCWRCCADRIRLIPH